jgi:hypothetical protein
VEKSKVFLHFTTSTDLGQRSFYESPALTVELWAPLHTTAVNRTQGFLAKMAAVSQKRRPVVPCDPLEQSHDSASFYADGPHSQSPADPSKEAASRYTPHRAHRRAVVKEGSRQNPLLRRVE